MKHSVLFDAGPEESAWRRNVERLGIDVSTIEVVTLSHWHRDHSGGLLEAIRMIRQGKNRGDALVVDIHADRPKYRGFRAGPESDIIVSMEANPSFDELAAAGSIVMKSTNSHTILDNMFLISGEIPRVTPYEVGMKGGVQFNEITNEWVKDELIMDERLLMCNLKGSRFLLNSSVDAD